MRLQAIGKQTVQMLLALKKSWPVIAAGLAITTVAAAGAYYFESSGIQQRSKIRAQHALVQSIDRLKDELKTATLGANLLASSRSSPQSLVKQVEFLNSGYTVRPGTSNWIYARHYQQTSQQVMISDLSQVFQKNISLSGRLEEPFYTVFVTEPSGGIAAPGFNLASDPVVAAKLAAVGDKPEMFVVKAGLTTIWPDGALVLTAKSPDGTMVLRGISGADLSIIAGLDDTQPIAVADDSAPDDYVGNATLQEGQTRFSAKIADGSSVGVVLPLTTPAPAAWLVVLGLGLASTAAAALYSAGQLLRGNWIRSDAQLADALKSEQVFFETAGTANCVVDAETQRFVRVNDRMCELFEFDREELIGKTVAEVSALEDIEKTSQTIAQLRSGSPDFVQLEKRYVKKSGEKFWALVNSRPFHIGAEQKAFFASAIVDLSERKEQERLRENLVRELAHRVRNSLQLASSLARQTAKSATSAQDFSDKFQGRLGALNVAQDLLFDTDWSEVDLKSVVERIMAPYLSASRDDILLDIQEVKLTPQEVQTLAIAIHELAEIASETVLAGGDGKIELSARLVAPASTKLELVWSVRSRNSSLAGEGVKDYAVLNRLLTAQFDGVINTEQLEDGFRLRALLTLSAAKVA